MIDESKLPKGTVRMKPLEMNAIRFSGDHTVLTPAVLETPKGSD